MVNNLWDARHRDLRIAAAVVKVVILLPGIIDQDKLHTLTREQVYDIATPL